MLLTYLLTYLIFCKNCPEYEHDICTLSCLHVCICITNFAFKKIRLFFLFFPFDNLSVSNKFIFILGRQFEDNIIDDMD